MRAPVYPPAVTYEHPKALPFEFNVANITIGELIASPVIRDIVYREAPGLKMVAQLPSFRMHLYNFTVGSLKPFGVVSPEAYKRIDDALRALPSDQRPAL